MQAPDFNYNNLKSQPQQPDAGSTELSAVAAPAVESASASTACQTSSSKFAYILTGSVLGLLTLLALAITFLAVSVLQATVDLVADGNPDQYYYDYGFDDDFDDYDYDYEDRYEDELDELEQKLIDEIIERSQTHV